MTEILPPPSIVTSDGKRVRPGDRVFNYYDCKWGRIAHDVDCDGWFHVNHEDGSSALLNGERIATYQPSWARSI